VSGVRSTTASDAPVATRGGGVVGGTLPGLLVEARASPRSADIVMIDATLITFPGYHCSGGSKRAVASFATCTNTLLFRCIPEPWREDDVAS
jgi:hypothetical protein